MNRQMEELLSAEGWAVRAGEPAADDFDAIVRLHQRRIFRLLLAMLRDEDIAETLTQETFLRAYRKRADFRGEGRLDGWLMRIAVNLGRDHIRSRRGGFWEGLVGGRARAGGRRPSAASGGRNPPRGGGGVFGSRRGGGEPGNRAAKPAADPQP